jgi:putative drug exporter of the RND superfamily
MRSVTAIGRWSARRPWRALAVWLAFVVACLAALAVTGTEPLENGAVGESARGYSLMDRHQAWPPAREYGYVHSDVLRAGDPRFRAAVADVAARMRAGLGGDVSVAVSRDRRSALVSGEVRRPISSSAFHASVLAAAARHPQVTVGEAGDVTASDARDRVVGRDLHRAELLSIPVTLAVLLIAFGAVVAALVPVLLAITAVMAAFGLSVRSARSSRSTTA